MGLPYDEYAERPRKRVRLNENGEYTHPGINFSENMPVMRSSSTLEDDGRMPSESGDSDTETVSNPPFTSHGSIASSRQRAAVESLPPSLWNRNSRFTTLPGPEDTQDPPYSSYMLPFAPTRQYTSLRGQGNLVRTPSIRRRRRHNRFSNASRIRPRSSLADQRSPPTTNLNVHFGRDSIQSYNENQNSAVGAMISPRSGRGQVTDLDLETQAQRPRVLPASNRERTRFADDNSMIPINEEFDDDHDEVAGLHPFDSSYYRNVRPSEEQQQANSGEPNSTPSEMGEQRQGPGLSTATALEPDVHAMLERSATLLRLRQLAREEHAREVRSEPSSPNGEQATQPFEGNEASSYRFATHMGQGGAERYASFHNELSHWETTNDSASSRNRLRNARPTIGEISEMVARRHNNRIEDTSSGELPQHANNSEMTHPDILTFCPRYEIIEQDETARDGSRFRYYLSKDMAHKLEAESIKKYGRVMSNGFIYDKKDRN